MPGSLPGIIIKLSADTKDAIQGLNRVKGALGETATTGDKIKAVMPKLGVALAAAGAAAGAMAVKFAIDGVNAFKQDEAAATALATTLGNLGLAHDTGRVERFIDTMQRETGVADDELRPAFDRLVRSTHNVTEAQRLLSLAMDISAGSGKPLEAVTAALGRAADGSTTALSRLGVGMSAAELKAMSFEQVTAKLGATFQGQAAAKAGTLQGSLNRLNVAFSELQESFGRGFIEGLTKSLGQAKTGTDKLTTALKNLEPAAQSAGSAIAELVVAVGQIVSFGSTVQTTLTNWFVSLAKSGEAGNKAAGAIYALYRIATFAFNPLQTVVDLLNLLSGNTDDSAASAKAATPDVNALARGYAILADNVRAANEAQAGYDIKKGLNAWTQRYTAQAKAAGQKVGFNGGTLQAWLDARKGDGSGGSGAQETFAERWQKAFDTSKQAFDSWYTDTLGGLKDGLAKAGDDIKSWASSMKSTLTSGLNLGEAFAAQFTDTGERSGVSLMQAFDKQIAQADFFGNVLSQIKASGADQSFIDHIASLGPAVGSALGQQMLDEGLVTELNAKWVGVQTRMQELTDTLIPASLLSAQASAQTMVDEFERQFGKGGDGRKRIFSLMDDLAAKAARSVKIDVDVTKHTSEIITKVYGGIDGNPATPMATGGIVTRPTFAMIGEAGPEAVIPLSRGASYGVGGSTVNINVNAGVGDPAAIGRTVVESIRAYERRSGKVFAAA